MTMPSVNVSYGNSDEWLSVAYRLGVAHPPGYPLYILILHTFMHAPIPGLSAAGKAHLSSVVLSVVTLMIVFSALWNLYNLYTVKKRSPHSIFPNLFSERLTLALVGTLTLGFTQIFWLYSIIAEKYSLSALFVALYLYFVTSILKYPRNQYIPIRFWYASAVTLGLGISHQQALILLIPSFIYLLTRYYRRFSITQMLIIAAVAFMGFVLPFLLLFYYNSSQAPASWPFTPNINGLLDFLKRNDLVGYLYQKEYFSSGYTANVNLNQAIDSLIVYLKVVFRSFAWWLIPIGIFSFYVGLTKYKKSFLVFLYAWLFLGLILAAYFQWPRDWGSQSLLARQYMPGLVVLPFLFYGGWLEIIRRLGNFFTVLFSLRLARITVLSLIIGGFIFMAVSNYRITSLKSYTLVSRRYQEILTSVKPQSIVTCFTDTSCFALLYEQIVNGLRPDVTIIPLAHPYLTKTVSNPLLHQFTYDRNPYLLLDIISWNLGIRPVYAVELSDYYYNVLGLDYPNMFYLPEGYYGELSRQIPEKITAIKNVSSSDWLKIPTNFSDPMQMQHKSAIARDHLLNGLIYGKMNLQPLSLNEYNQAANIFFQFSPADRKQFTQLRTNLERFSANPKFKPGAKVPDIKALLKLIPELLSKNLNGQAYKAALAAVVIDPRSPLAHLALAGIFEKMGDYGFAQKEYSHTLILDPQNTLAKDRLKVIGTSNPLDIQ
jgi:hypothetical protein